VSEGGAGAERAATLLREAQAAGVFSGACLAWARLGEPPALRCVGTTAWPGLGLPTEPVGPETVWDLASLTKPLCTSAAAMLAVESGELTLEERVGALLPSWRGGLRDELRIEHLLAHEGGLPWWLPFYRDLPAGPRPERRRALRAALLELAPAQGPGAQAVYSDPGFLLLDWALEEAAGEPLAQRVARTLWRPWGLDLGFVEQGRAPGLADGGPLWCRDDLLRRAPVAATERCPWRGRVLRAEVHDENAHFLGGRAPHAGLFGRVGDVLGFGLGLLAVALGRSRMAGLSAASVERFWRGGGRPQGATWALGWDRPSPGGSSAGRRVSGRARGHLGFTGTSLWIDPERAAVVVLLSNRVHPSRSEERLRALRPLLHDCVWETLDRGPG